MQEVLQSTEEKIDRSAYNQSENMKLRSLLAEKEDVLSNCEYNYLKQLKDEKQLTLRQKEEWDRVYILIYTHINIYIYIYRNMYVCHNKSNI